MLGKRKNINLPSARDMQAALNEVRRIQNRHDARLMLLVFLDRAALFAHNLKGLGKETDESIEALFKDALESSKKPRKPPVVTGVDGANAPATGVKQ